KYDVWFAVPSSPALGTVTLNGTAIATNQAVTVGDLSGLSYVGSTIAGTDKLWVRAYNGTQVSGWVLATLTDPGVTPPTVSATNATVTHGQSVALTSLFSASASAGETISQFKVQLLGSSGAAPVGTLTQNGTAVATGQAVAVSSLAGLAYVGGT